MSFPTPVWWPGPAMSFQHLFKSEMMGTASWSFTCTRQALGRHADAVRNKSGPTSQAGQRRMVGHHVPDRTPVRHRPAQVKDQGRAPKDGGYRSPAPRFFISAGEHDLTDNIVHRMAPCPMRPKAPVASPFFVVPGSSRSTPRATRASAMAFPAAPSSTRWASVPPLPPC